MAWQFKIQRGAKEIANTSVAANKCRSSRVISIWQSDVIDDEAICGNDYLESSSIFVLFSIH